MNGQPAKNNKMPLGRHKGDFVANVLLITASNTMSLKVSTLGETQHTATLRARQKLLDAPPGSGVRRAMRGAGWARCQQLILNATAAAIAASICQTSRDGLERFVANDAPRQRGISPLPQKLRTEPE